MTTGAIPYAKVTELVDQGMFVVFAAGTMDGAPCCAWMAATLQPASAVLAYSPRDVVRVAQMVGATGAVRTHFRSRGFTPA